MSPPLDLDLTPVTIEESLKVYPHGAYHKVCKSYAYWDEVHHITCGRCGIGLLRASAIGGFTFG
jgi:hypothetical protein